MKTFILLSALPGAGKSTWAEQYRLTHKNVHVVSSDRIRLELTGEVQNFTKEKEVWAKFMNDILFYRDYSDDVTVIADSTAINNNYRLIYARGVTGFDKMVLLIIKKPIEIILRQNKMRVKDLIVPENIILNMKDSWEEPSEEVVSYFDEYLQIFKWFDSSKVKPSFHEKP